MRKKKVLLLVCALFMLFAIPSAFAIDLTGKWSCDAGGVYYIRQAGNTVWWYGEGSDTDPGWSNVANGQISGKKAKQISLKWADVPKGIILGKGQLVIKVLSKDELVLKSQKGDFFATSQWNRIVE